MEIVLRKEAIGRGENQYFTGIPCKNGHTTYRYTSSGACSACIRSYGAPVEVLQKRLINRDHIAEMISFRVRLYSYDLAFFRSIVLASTQAREPSVILNHCWKDSLGVKRDGETAVYTFHCFAEDCVSLKATAQSLCDARGPNIADIRRQREQALTDIERKANEEYERNLPPIDR